MTPRYPGTDTVILVGDKVRTENVKARRAWIVVEVQSDQATIMRGSVSKRVPLAMLQFIERGA